MSKNVFTDEELLIGFLQERYRHRGGLYFNRPYDCPLPEAPSGFQTVTLFADQVRQFRDDYALLVAFAANVCEAPAQDLGPHHLLTYLLKKSNQNTGEVE